MFLLQIREADTWRMYGIHADDIHHAGIGGHSYDPCIHTATVPGNVSIVLVCIDSHVTCLAAGTEFAYYNLVNEVGRGRLA